MCTPACHEKLANGIKAYPLPMGGSPPWWPEAPGLRRDELRATYNGKEYIGYLVAPPEEAGKRPLVIIVHNFQGVKYFDVHQAEYMARLGYVGLAVDMYDIEVLPPEARLQPEGDYKAWLKACFSQMVDVDHNIPKTRGIMKSWIEAGLAHPTVDNSFAPASIGYCFGGAVLIEAVRGGLNLSAAVSLHGLLQSAEDPAPFNLVGVQRPPKIEEENNYNTKTVLLIENGTADQLVPPESVARFVEEFEAAKVDWRFYNHGSGCPHGFALPPSLGASGVLHELGDRRSTTDMLALFAEVFPGVPQNRVERNAAGTAIPQAIPSVPAPQPPVEQVIVLPEQPDAKRVVDEL